MAKITVTLKVKFPWWMNAYFGMVGAFYSIGILDPDTDAMAEFIMRHTKIVAAPV